MTNTELNQYIKHYLEKDKTKSAIMLSGDWGTGKSHYIQNELVDVLKKDSNIQCVIVSLYGMKTTSEISKSIYLDIRLKNKQLASQNSKAARFFRKAKKKIEEHKEIATGGAILAKTVVKGVTSFFSVDLSLSEDDMQKLYESMDLSGKLIILEDLERSRINILDVLGYVNSLVEQDGVKVMLVANESEIIKYEPIKEDTQEKQEYAELLDQIGDHSNRKYTEITKKYLAVKEKTVGDTVEYEGNLKTAVQEIIKIYNNPVLNNFSNAKHVQDICDIMTICRNYNLRSFIFACQKAVDIFEKISDQYNDDFVQCIFYGIIFFTLRLKSGKVMRWDGNENYSITLGHDNAPLFKFCYEYIMWQTLDLSKVPVAADAFSKKLLYDKRKTSDDKDLVVLRNYHLYYESEVIKALESITERLDNPEDISFYDYGAVATYLIQIKYNLGYDIETAKSMLVKNLEGHGSKLGTEEIFRTVLRESDTPMGKEYKELRQKMEEALKKSLNDIPDFEYQPEKADDFYSYAVHNDTLFHRRGRFTYNLDIQRLAKMFFESTPEQKDNIRGAFLSVYRVANIKQFITDDYSSIEALRSIIEADAQKETDKVQKLQYEWFISNLNDILKKLA